MSKINFYFQRMFQCIVLYQDETNIKSTFVSFKQLSSGNDKNNAKPDGALREDDDGSLRENNDGSLKDDDGGLREDDDDDSLRENDDGDLRMIMVV